MAPRDPTVTTAMAASCLFSFLLLLLLLPAAAAAITARRPLFREYIGAEGQNVTFADVPVHPGVDFHCILAFAIDYAAASHRRPLPRLL